MWKTDIGGTTWTRQFTVHDAGIGHYAAAGWPRVGLNKIDDVTVRSLAHSQLETLRLQRNQLRDAESHYSIRTHLFGRLITAQTQTSTTAADEAVGPELH